MLFRSIFCNRKRDVALLHRSLLNHGFTAAALHGDMDQPARMASLDAFRRGDVALLVASDVAARGLDIPDVSHVFNFDVPHHADDYVHRIGRTGRADAEGDAFVLVSPAEEKSLAQIERHIGERLPRVTLPDFDYRQNAPAKPEVKHGGARPAKPKRHRGRNR